MILLFILDGNELFVIGFKWMIKLYIFLYLCKILNLIILKLYVFEMEVIY